MTRRMSRFVAIGAGGFLVQLTTAAVLLAVGLSPVLATLLAIEAAILHNHVWHRRWAWRDRAGVRAWPVTVLRAHLGAGGSSLVVGVLLVAALDGLVPPLAAQSLAVVACAAVNFVLADRWIFGASVTDRGVDHGASGRAVVYAVIGAACLATPVHAEAGPSREALHGWQRYGAALAQARAAEAQRGNPAWATDDDRTGKAVLATLQRGDAVIGRRSLSHVEVDGATLEHWQGSLLLRGVSLAQVAHRLRHPESYPQPPDVRALQVSARTETGHDLYLRVTRSMVVTATYDTWHQVRHAAPQGDRLESVSASSRIQEVDDAGTPRERRLAADEGRGFLWRMQSFWRFTAVPGGVVVTCESITLSRPVPFGLGLITRPAITRVARESMTTAIRAWQRGWTGAASGS